MEKTTSFQNDLGLSLEEQIKRRNYQTVILNFPVKKFDAIEQEGKKDANDYNCELNDGTKLKIEFKNRREGANANFMCLEVHNNIQSKVVGWTFKLIRDKTDYVICTWHGKEKPRYIILKARELELWWREHYKDYKLNLNKPTIWGDRKWTSSYCFVPIKDIPNEIIFKKDIMPKLCDYGGKR